VYRQNKFNKLLILIWWGSFNDETLLIQKCKYVTLKWHCLLNLGDVIEALCCFNLIWIFINCIGGVMVSVLASSAVDCGFEPRSGQTKDYEIGICCFSAKHASLRKKSKDWLTRNQDNVSEWSDMSFCGLLFQWARTIEIQLSVLV
jgi:hypothetical protein